MFTREYKKVAIDKKESKAHIVKVLKINEVRNALHSVFLAL